MISLKNCTLMHLNPAEIRTGVDIVIEGAKIASVGEGAAGEGPGETCLDLHGKIVAPGLVCSHNHFYSGLARGILAHIEPSTDFVSHLSNLWWRLDRAIDEEILHYSALVCAVEAVRCGCTAVIDHNASPSFIAGSLDVIRSCFEKVGLRGILCYETTDRNGPEELQKGIEENIRFAQKIEQEKKTGVDIRLVEAMIGGHAPFTLPDEGLHALGQAVKDTGRGFHVHVSEDRFDPSFSHRRYNKDVLQRLDEFGLLDEKAILAHGIHLTDHDAEILTRRRSFVAHNCRSNMNNHVGYNSRLPDLLNITLGTDGIGSDMIAETQNAYYKHRDSGGVLTPNDYAGFLHNGNAILARYFENNFGRIEEGYTADLTIFDYESPTPLVNDNVAGHLIFGLSSRHVGTVIINGRIVMANRKLPWDTEEVFAQARAAAEKLWHRMDAGV